MTVWENIYRKKKKNSPTWNTPSERYFPLFQRFLIGSKFKTKHALDIGCGIGKFLKLLESNEFLTEWHQTPG